MCIQTTSFIYGAPATTHGIESPCNEQTNRTANNVRVRAANPHNAAMFLLPNVTPPLSSSVQTARSAELSPTLVVVDLCLIWPRSCSLRWASVCAGGLQEQ